MTASCTIKSERLQRVGGVIRNRRLVRGKPEGGLTIELLPPTRFPRLGMEGWSIFLMMQMFWCFLALGPARWAFITPCTQASVFWWLSHFGNPKSFSQITSALVQQKQTLRWSFGQVAYLGGDPRSRKVNQESKEKDKGWVMKQVSPLGTWSSLPLGTFWGTT